MASPYPVLQSSGVHWLGRYRLIGKLIDQKFLELPSCQAPEFWDGDIAAEAPVRSWKMSMSIDHEFRIPEIDY